MTKHWSYTALDRDGRTLRGRIAAEDEAGVARQLGRTGARPLAIRPERAVLKRLGGDSLTRRELSQVLRELATMLGAGQDLDHALTFLEQTAPGGRVVIPVRRGSRQVLLRVIRMPGDGVQMEPIEDVCFVPLIGAQGEPER